MEREEDFINFYEKLEGEGEGKGEGEEEPMEGEGAPAEIDSERVNDRDIPDTNGGRLQWLVVIVCVISGSVGFWAGRLLITSYFQWGAHTQLLKLLVLCIGVPMPFLPILDRQNRSLFVTTKYILVCGILCAVAIILSPLYSTGAAILCPISFVYGACFTSLLFQHGITASNLGSFIFLLTTLVEPGNSSSGENPGVSRGHIILGFVFTILACATSGLVFPLAYLAFRTVTGEDTLAIFCISLSFAIVVANMVSIAGLLINGDFEYLMSEDRHARPGEAEYLVTFTFNALDWQFLFLAIAGWFYLASSLSFKVIM